jgi:NAD/NADP transhydrogenase beta subunit
VKTWRCVVRAAVIAGALVGICDLLLQKWLPYPWANLANSGAVWAVAAFLVGAWVRDQWRRSAVAGIILLIVAVESYYVTAAIVLNDNLANAWSKTAFVWLALGVVAGAVFGIAGAISRSSRRVPRLLGYASLTAVFGLEALLVLGRSTNADETTVHNHLDLFYTATIEVALAVAVPVGIILFNRRAVSRNGLPSNPTSPPEFFEGR